MALRWRVLKTLVRYEGRKPIRPLLQAHFRPVILDDLTVSESDGRPENLKPFTRGELLKPLERWFFGR